MAADPLSVARTESLFRDVNERIAETARRLNAEEAMFVCECADSECGERFEAELADYERVRADGTRFLVAPGHEEPNYEEVIRRRSEYRVVSKDVDDRVKRTVCDLDPRNDSGG
jgi:hypothetical protein